MPTFGDGWNRGRRTLLAAGASLAIAAIPLTTAFADEEQERPEPRPAPKHEVKPAALPVTNNAACQAALTALHSFVLGDRAEDATERQQARLNTDETSEEAAEALDQTEDQQESANAQAARAAAEKACAPQPPAASQSCLTAQAQLKAFNLAERGEDQQEHQLQTGDVDDNAQAAAAARAEDQAEKAQEQPLHAAVTAACGDQDR